jgi:hypothetical protein
MKAMILASVSVVIMLGFMLQLVDIADSTSNKALHFADSMDRAMDCAISGVSLDVCSPELKNTDFSQDAREFQRVNIEFLKKALNQTGNETY